MYREVKLENAIKYQSRRRLSANLLNYRKENDMARESLALECEMDTKYLCKIEHGTASATVDTLDKLSDGTGIPVWKLVSD